MIGHTGCAGAYMYNKGRTLYLNAGEHKGVNNVARVPSGD